MDVSGGNSPVARAEQLLRLLSVAANAVRLYPVSSPMREDAIARFAETSHSLTAAGALQLRVDRERFLLGDVSVGAGQTQIAALAEALHALQVGQLIIASGATTSEVGAFLDILGADAKTVRGGGGARAALIQAGVRNIALVEVSLRVSSESGILGMDLTAAPLDDIASELQTAVDAWVASGHDRDDIAGAIGGYEAAAQDLAARRIGEALLRLDEATRVRVVSAAMLPGNGAKPMKGMLDAIAQMQPAALARLLKLVATSAGEAPDSLLGAIEIPPEVARELAALLRPSPQSDQERGVPAEADAPGIVAEVAEYSESDQEHVETLVAASTPAQLASKALSTTLQVAAARPTEESVIAIGDAVRTALERHVYAGLGAAFVLLAQLASNPALSMGVSSVRTSLAEEILEAYVNAPADARAYLATETGRLAEIVGPVAARVLRTGTPERSAIVVELLVSLRDKRLTPVISQALDHLDGGVRAAAITALADMPGKESASMLQRALAHWDPQTRRIAAREIGRANRVEALPALLRLLEEVYLFERNYELKKEVLRSLELMRPAQARSVLTRMARRRFVIGKKNRELRYLAQRTLSLLESS
ncbi:MAG: HEAT repeat domain-containing protein [Actinomycetota bacterium]|nr:MAG: hypothetical protein FD171_330 [Actinomycetota bacterium]MDO8950295.1 HEAT repeat domain-containing protein [Actinomycetota bacterium]MDP3629778.1 HEAT repeat domain-containing protein [Actinomycetota bacterium]